MANISFLILFLLLPLANPSQSAAAATQSSPGEDSGQSSNGGSAPTQRLWCVAKNNAEDSELQTALNWACGPGGANCGPIQQGGPCYDTNDVIGMASYAFNDYYLKHGMTDDACNFSNTAALSQLNPSHDKCQLQSSGGSSSDDRSSTSSSSTAMGINPYTTDTSRCDRSTSMNHWRLLLLGFFVLALDYYGAALGNFCSSYASQFHYLKEGF